MRASIGLSTTSSLIALFVAGIPTAAWAQDQETQTTAQQANDQIECSTVSDPDEHRKCIKTQGENALPQAGAPASDTIVVTGSRIKRPNFDTAEPIVVIDTAQIEARGFETLGQALNEQPSFGVPGSSPVGNAQAGSFGSGQSFVNFLGLGDQRTLTLVNGRRFVSSNTASIFGPSNAGTQVDLNTINTKLVDRVETIAIGGAPIYGSDAIAGTVNVILKRSYEGIDVDAQSGFSSRADAENYRVRALAGHNFLDGRANVTISGEYNKGEGLLYNDRRLTRLGRFEGDCPPGSQFTVCVFDNRRIPSISESGIITTSELFGVGFPLSPEQSNYFFGDPSVTSVLLDANGNQLQFDSSGNLIPIDFGTAVGDPDNSFNIDFSGGNGFNIANTSQLLTDTKRYNANLLTNFDVTDNVRLFGEGWFAYSKGTNLRSQPVYNSQLFDSAGTPDGPIILSINNPFLTNDQRALIQQNIDNGYSDQNLFGVNQDYFYLQRANTDLVSGRASSATRLYRVVGGLDGKFAVGDRNFTWEVVGNYGRAVTKGREPTLVQQNFQNAVNAVLDANGNIVCAPGSVNAPIETLSSTCAPLNLFGNGVASQAAIDYVTTIADPHGTNTQRVFTASIAGPTLRLPGGDLGFALGVEARRESTKFNPGKFYFGGDDTDPLTDTNGNGDPTDDREQFGRSIPILPVAGSYKTREMFGELRAPILSPSNNVPGLYSVELHGAARYVDHSVAGGDWTYTAEGRWGIVSDLALRANYTSAIRAPAITELFNPSSSAFGFAVDPCDRRNTGSGPDPATRAANCAAAGIPTNFSSLSNQRSFPTAIVGNADLDNEKSKAFSVGAVLNPRFIPGLRISADYIGIRLKSAISFFGNSQVLNACYDSPSYPSNPFCSAFTRDPATNQLNFVSSSYFNASEYRYKGLLGSLDYRTRTPFLGAKSRLGFNISYQYLRSLTQKADELSAPTTINGSIGYPKHSAVVSMNYENGPVGLFTSINYTGRVKEDPDAAANYYQYPNRDAVVFVNGGFNVDVNDRMTFRFVVDNIFDTDPPFPSPAGGGAISYFPGLLGRYFRVGAAIHF